MIQLKCKKKQLEMNLLLLFLQVTTVVDDGKAFDENLRRAVIQPFHQNLVQISVLKLLKSASNSCNCYLSL